MRADPALGLLGLELVQRVEPGGILEGPPVELQEIHLAHAEPLQPLLDAGAHHLGRHRLRRRAPFGEGERPLRPAPPRQQPSGHQLGAAVVIGHVEGVEAGIGIGAERVGRPVEVERRAVLLHVGDLPETRQDAADGEVRGELEALGLPGHVGLRV